MPAYLFVFRDSPVSEPEEMKRYLEKSRGAPPNGMQPRVVYGAVHALEGAAPDGVVMVEFPDVEAARAWYHSPEYQAAIPHRQRAATWRAMLVEGMDPSALPG